MSYRTECLLKRPIKEVSKAVARAKDQTRKSGRNIEWYECKFCGKFHTGTAK